MSDPGPFGNGGNPFEGVPFFGDLVRMMQTQGPMSWDAARQLALSVASAGESPTNLDPAGRIHFEELVRVAELQVAHATGLSTASSGTTSGLTAWTRTEWVHRALDNYRPLFDDLASALQGDQRPANPLLGLDGLSGAEGDPLGFLAPLMQVMAPMMLGMTAGSMVGQLALRNFGPYSLPIPWGTDDLGVLLTNIQEFGDDWSLPADDLQLWICLHELTHHAVLRLPHVRDRLTDLIHRYLKGFKPDPRALESRLESLDLMSEGGDLGQLGQLGELFSDPEVLLGAMRSPGQDDVVPQLDALVAVIVGYVDHMLDRIGHNLIGSYEQVSEAVRRQRVETSDADRFVERLFGLELTQATYDRGSTFIAGIVERAGDQSMERLWSTAAMLPTPAEVDAPGLWLARIELSEP